MEGERKDLPFANSVPGTCCLITTPPAVVKSFQAQVKVMALTSHSALGETIYYLGMNATKVVKKYNLCSFLYALVLINDQFTRKAENPSLGDTDHVLSTGP